jgi:hypothetical protein
VVDGGRRANRCIRVEWQIFDRCILHAVLGSWEHVGEQTTRQWWGLPRSSFTRRATRSNLKSSREMDILQPNRLWTNPAVYFYVSSVSIASKRDQLTVIMLKVIV